MRALFLLAWLIGGCAAGGSYEAGPRYGGLSCIPFARALTGVGLRGDAPDWWATAGPPYQRRSMPVEGSILVFAPSDRLPRGHVSVVSRVLSDREIAVIQANWLPRTLETDRPVIDVSAAGDWSMVRVWWAPSGQVGTHAYPTLGFIVPPNPLPHDTLARAAPQVARQVGG